MRTENEMPRERLAAIKRGGIKLTGAKVINRPPESKPSDLVERKLSLTLDALLDTVEFYREAMR